jgi:hypothetical protein
MCCGAKSSADCGSRAPTPRVRRAGEAGPRLPIPYSTSGGQWLLGARSAVAESPSWTPRAPLRRYLRVYGLGAEGWGLRARGSGLGARCQRARALRARVRTRESLCTRRRGGWVREGGGADCRCSLSRN